MMPIVPDEEDLPGWVPKNYIEKGNLPLVLFVHSLFNDTDTNCTCCLMLSSKNGN
jgi:hypothetical protein